MTNKEVLNFIQFWLSELEHAGYTNVDEKRKILKLVRREIRMSLDMGFISEDGNYVESGMAKLMGERYPDLRIRNMQGSLVSADSKVNGLDVIGKYIEKYPRKVTYADYLHWKKLSRYFSMRRVMFPIDTVEEAINFKSNIVFKNGKFILKNMEEGEDNE